MKDLAPTEDWYKGGTEETLQDAAVTMLIQGMDEDSVEEVLNDVIRAVRDEYGD